jgi:hypothetical protein
VFCYLKLKVLCSEELDFERELSVGKTSQNKLERFLFENKIIILRGDVMSLIFQIIDLLWQGNASLNKLECFVYLRQKYNVQRLIYLLGKLKISWNVLLIGK